VTGMPGEGHESAVNQKRGEKFESANRESASGWKQFLTSLRYRGLRGVQLAISDDHAGLRRAIRAVLPEAVWQRCYVG